VKNEIRILILEDVPADVVMINHELRNAHLTFRSKRVDTRDEFLSELEHETPDLILSDHGLPGFDGFTALAMAKDKCPDVPFIFVTSALGEELTIETFESGATDYVLKHRLSNLAPAVQRALREAEEKRKRREAEAALKESEERFRTLVAGVKDYAIFMVDCEGLVTSWNSGAEWITGYRADEIIGQHFRRFYTQEEAQKRRPEHAVLAAAAGGRFEEEGWRIRKGGSKFRAHVVITALRSEKGELRGFAQVTRNVTDHKAVQEALARSEARKSAILASALDAILYLDDKGVIHEWNAAAEKMFGYSRDEAIGQKMDRLIIPPFLQDIYKQGVADYFATGVASLLGRPVEVTLRRADKTEFQAEVGITRIAGQEPPHYAVVIHDIAERKKT